MVELILQQKRYRVLTARTGREALARVREAVPDLAILDGMLPEVHGFEICRQLKTSERFRHIPVIMVSAVHTGWRFAADVKERYGADDYLEKPLDQYALDAALMAVSVDTRSGTWTAGSPAKVVGALYATLSSAGGRTYDVSSDGKRFLMVKQLASQAAPQIILVQHWFEELKRLAPIS